MMLLITVTLEEVKEMQLKKSDTKFPEEQICDLIMAEYKRIHEEENPSNAKDFVTYIHRFTGIIVDTLKTRR